MADVIDNANDLSQQEITQILAKRNTVFIGESAINYLECGELIPEKRRQPLKGCKLCVDCQQLNEKRTR